MEQIVTKITKNYGPINIFTRKNLWDLVPRIYLRKKIYGTWSQRFIRKKKFINPGPRDFITGENSWDHKFMENS